MINKHLHKWGYEVWIINTKKYCGKLLILRHGWKSSLHFHKKKDETFYIDNGTVYMETTNKAGNLVGKVMKIGESVRIRPNSPHRFRSISKLAKVIEFSTHHLESDSYRIEESCKLGRHEQFA